MEPTVFTDIHTHNRRGGAKTVYSCRIGTEEKPAGEICETGGIIFSAGVHPWDADKADMKSALEYLQHAPVIAIGEIGLDYSLNTDRELQKTVFEKHLAVAEDRALPVVLHCVRAYNDIILILRRHRLRGVVFHGYTGSVELTGSILREGYCLSFGPNSLKSAKTVESLKKVPLDRIFIETDDSGVPVETVYAHVAAILGMSVETLAAAVKENFNRILA